MAWLGGSMAASLVVAAWVLRLWDADLHVPFSIGGDGNAAMMVVKDLISSPWYFTNDSLGAPYGQDLLDYPGWGGDVIHMVIFKLLGLAWNDVAAVTNVYFLLTFPLTAGTAYVVLRALTVSQPSSAACAVLFATLPYHFLRGEYHLFLSGYFAVPVGAFLVISVLNGRTLVRRRAAAVGASGLSRTTLTTIAACALVACGSVYYSVFTLILLVLVTLVALVQADRGRVIQGLLVTGIVAAAIAVTLTPAVIHQISDGANPAVGKRSPEESERFAFTLGQLVVPIKGHRIEPFARLSDHYLTNQIVVGEGTASLGLVSTVGLLLAMALLVAGLPASRWRRDWGVAQAAALAAVLALLLGTVGGLSSLIAHALTSQIRHWNRLSVFIAFFSLVLIALLLDVLRTRLGGRPPWRGFSSPRSPCSECSTRPRRASCRPIA